MSELLDDCQLNTFDYSVTLPQSDNSPSDEFFFQVHFFCNGVEVVSPTLNSVYSAYVWAITILPDVGDWSLDDNILTVTGTICETGSLTFAYAEEVAVYGCIDPNSSNFMYWATVSDGSCSGAVTPTGGCKNQAATNYCASCTFDNGTCTFASNQTVLNSAAKKAEVCQIGACLFQTYDKGKLAGFTAKGIELNFQVYYITFGSKNASDATEFNTFLAAVNADAVVYLSIKASDSLNDWFVSTFSAVAAEADQESQLSSKGITDAQYVAWLQATVTRYAPLPIIEDSSPIYRTTSSSVNRNLALAPLTYTTIGRQYEQLAPDRMVFSATDQDYNLSLINNYYDTLLPTDITQFFALLTHLTTICVTQFHITDVGQQKPSDALTNYAIGRMGVLTHQYTEKFKYLFYMRFGELVHGDHVEFGAMKIISPSFRFTYTLPITVPLSGVVAQAFTDGANSWGILLVSQNATDQTISKSNIVIPAKTISGNFTRTSNYADDFYQTTILNETVSEANITVRRCGTTWVTFNTV